MKVFLDVYLNNNIGDDLMIMGILKEFPMNTYYAISDQKEVIKTYENFSNLQFVSYDLLERTALLCDVYLTLGGSVFQVRSFKDLIFRYFKVRLLRKLRLKNIKVITVGANLGPYNFIFGKTMVNKEIKLNNDVTLRDIYSYEQAKKVILNNATFADDLVFEIVEKQEVIKSHTLGVSAYTSVSPNIDNEELRKSYVSFINRYLEKNPNHDIKLFAFDTLGENDLDCANYIIENVSKISKVTIVSYDGNSDLFLSEFMSCHKMLAVRFHSAILSEIFNIDYYPISYSNKMSNYIMDSYGVSSRRIEDFIKKPIDLNDFNNGIVELSNRAPLVSGHMGILSKYLS